MSKRPFISEIKNIVYAMCILLSMHCITSCGPKSFDRDEVISHYGPEVINYFYETAFHMDRDGGIRDEGLRWNEDIRVSLHGEMLENDSALVSQAILEINSLDLPVSMSLVSDPQKSNYKMFFGNAKALADSLRVDSVTTLGVVTLGDKSGAIEWVKIGILNNPKMYSQTNTEYALFLRKETILEEMTQALGIIGDSYTYYTSRFFEGANNVGGLSDMDRKVVKLLYDNRVFPGRVLRRNFEERYTSLLYDRISSEKLRSLVYEYGLDSLELRSLAEMVFHSETGERFVKFPRTAFLKVSGDFTGDDVKFCGALVSRFNTITPWFQLRLEESNGIWNTHPTITIHYEDDERYKGVINTQVGVAAFEMMFTYHISGDIWMKFNSPKKELVSYDKAVLFHREGLTRALFKALGLSIREKILVNAVIDSIEIDRKYEDYFRVLYDPRVPSGIMRAEFERLLGMPELNASLTKHTGTPKQYSGADWIE